MKPSRRFHSLALLCALSLACSDEETTLLQIDEPELTAESEHGQSGQAAESSSEENAETGQNTEVPEDLGPPKRIFARRFVVTVRDRPVEEAERIGYLRAGAVVQATTSAPMSMEGCRGGWYELTSGGFVCATNQVTPFDGDDLPQARSRQPDRDADLPYTYGYVRRDVPMYRSPPSLEQAAEHEGFRLPGEEPPEGEGGENAEGGGSAAAGGSEEASAMNESSMETSSAMSETSMAIGQGMAASAMEGAEAGAEAEEEEEPQVTLASLAGERDSIVMRRMMRGFYVSLDRDFRRDGRRYWRTQNNGFVPYRAIVERRGSEFQGAMLNDEVTLPYAFAMDDVVPAFTRDERGRFRRSREGTMRRREGFPILETIEDRGQTYVRGPGDVWYRTRRLRIAEPEPMRPEMGPDDKWIDINLETQTLVAYEGERPVYVTLISSGQARRSFEPDKDWETLPGLHRIKSKHLTDTMDGDSAFDGPYSVDDVPYVMYYELAYALHTAFWHGNFGYPKSHGCVNIAPRDSRWIFNWSDPPLPDGWHSVYPTEEVSGTWLWIHGETLGRR